MKKDLCSFRKKKTLTFPRLGVRSILVVLIVLFLLGGCGNAAPVQSASALPGQSSSMEPAAQNTSEPEPSQPGEPVGETPTPSEEPTPSPEVEPSDSAEPEPTDSGAGTPATLPNGRTQSMFNGEPIKVKAVYLTGPKAGVALDHYINLVNETELNALVIDIKETVVNYESMVPIAQEHKLYTKYYNVDEVIRKCHENGIYVIGRIVVFRDNNLAKAKPEYAIRKADGSYWLENKSKDGAWTSPAVQEVLDYNIAVAVEAVEHGFDEIQFDYVRFPTVPKSNPASYPEDMPDKIDIIDGFLHQASEKIKAVREVPISADVFGIIAESVSDGKAIGQQLEYLGANADYLCPMIYPSHYANAGSGIMGNGVGQKINGVLFTAPDLHPYDVILQSLLKTKSRAEAAPDFKAGIRPYLQDFTAKYIKNPAYFQSYGPKQLREQIQAVYDAGYEEWILWNGSNIYSESGLLPADQE